MTKGPSTDTLDMCILLLYKCSSILTFLKKSLYSVVMRL